MNEIEKMYELIGIEANPYCCDNSCGEPTKKCKDCADYREIYPPFTAEKQLELIDWFIKNEADIEIIFDCNDELYYFRAEFDETISCKSFAEALANLINIYLEDFTDREIEEIKEILK